jgi:O-antigen/teichoic acid export membrane protein
MSVRQHFYEHLTDDKSIWRRFRRNVSITAFGSGLSLAIKFAQTALLTRVLSIEDFGRLLIVLNFFVFLDSFFGMRVSDAMFRFFPSFKEQGEERSLKGLLLFCSFLCLTSGLLIYGLVFFLSPRLADRFYPNLGLAPLFRIYGCTILLISFSGVYEPILRLHDRFSSVVAPQVLGGIITLVLLFVYFAQQSTYSLQVVVAIFTIGVFIQTIPPLIQATWLVRRFSSGPNIYESMRALNQHRSALTKTFLNSNLSGYLKLAISPGDIFLLGLFSTPTQLAWYGLAKQFTAPLAFLQTNIQTAVTPEIAALTSKRKFAQLKSLLARYLVRTFAISSLLLIFVILVGHVLIVNFLPAGYATALPVFYLLSVAAWLLLVFLVFRPLALSLDQLKWHNLALFASTCLVVIVILAGRLSAMTMAVIQLADALIIRSLFSAIVWSRVENLAKRL